jgi:nucleoside phosphorylase
MRAAAIALLAACSFACGKARSTLVVLSALPAEMEPILEHTEVASTVEINGHVFRRGRIAGRQVAVGLVGIGIVNATNTSRAALDQLDARGVVFSGVAGSTLRIADVAVAQAWQNMDGQTYAAAPDWVDLARRLSQDGVAALERSTVVPSSGKAVCLSFQPALFVGGVGRSSDMFGGKALACQTEGDDVFGCDLPPNASRGPTGLEACSMGQVATGTVAAPDPTMPISVDNETGAVAAEASGHGVPFIGFRGVSDGAGDPLHLPGFPSQFFAYYRLSARNSAAAAVAFIERLKD